MRDLLEFLLLLPRNAGVLVIRGYRAVISPLYGDVCRYYPSCSAYGLGSVQQRGLVVGSALTLWRILRCNPWSRGGVDHVRVARAYGATPVQIASRVYLPSMLPILLEAVRLAMIFNLTGILLAEMYASRAGLGQLIASWGENFQLKELLAGILLISVAAILFNETVRWFESRCEHWRA